MQRQSAHKPGSGDEAHLSCVGMLESHGNLQQQLHTRLSSNAAPVPGIAHLNCIAVPSHDMFDATPAELGIDDARSHAGHARAEHTEQGRRTTDKSVLHLSRWLRDMSSAVSRDMECTKSMAPGLMQLRVHRSRRSRLRAVQRLRQAKRSRLLFVSMAWVMRSACGVRSDANQSFTLTLVYITAEQRPQYGLLAAAAASIGGGSMPSSAWRRDCL